MFKKLFQFILEFDRACINTVERACQYLQEMIGLNNFSIARLLLMMYAIADYSTPYQHESIITWVVIIFIGMLAISFIESLTKTLDGVCYINPVKENPVFLFIRMTVFLVVMFEFGRGHFYFRDLFFLLFWFVFSSNPLPPGISKLGLLFRQKTGQVRV